MPDFHRLWFAFTLKGYPPLLEGEAFCLDASGVVHCGIEGDGDEFTERA